MEWQPFKRGALYLEAYIQEIIQFKLQQYKETLEAEFFCADCLLQLSNSNKHYYGNIINIILKLK